ncbi:MAG: hypothetical protein ACE5HU_04095 [Acidobacteriota bacterium]
MSRSSSNRPWPGGPVVLALAASLLGLTVSTAEARASSRDADLLWLRVEVRQNSDDHTRVKIAVPLSLVQVVLESRGPGGFLDQINHGHAGIDLAKMWRSVRDMDVDEFATIETDEEQIKVWKDTEFFRVSIQEDKNATLIDVKLPLALMDYLFDSDGTDFNFQQLIETLGDAAPLTLISVQSDEESVKIWIERR